MTSDYDTVILTGATGALGGHVLAELLAQDIDIVCIANSDRSIARLGAMTGAAGGRLKIVQWDIRDGEAMADTARRIGSVGRALVIHCAGEVSWSKPDRLVAPLNLDGTRNVATLAQAVSTTQPSFVFVSTAFCEEGFACRNAYERSKLAAERMLRTEFADRLRIAIVKCSLIVGSSVDGRIDRFNGVYPLVRLVASAETPCLVADKKYAIDCVGVDVIWREIHEAAHRLRSQTLVCSTVASGSDSPTVETFVDTVSRRTNRFRARHERPPLPIMSVLAERQFRFLMQASQSWDLAERFRKVEQISDIMSGYILHGGSGRPIEPRMLLSDHPSIRDYADGVIDYWLEHNMRHALRTDTPGWATDAGVLA